MTSLHKNINDLILILTKIPDIWEEFRDNPTEDNGEKIVEIMDISEKKLLTIKKNIVIMINEMKEEESFDVKVIPSKNGFIIINDKEQ